MSPLRPTPSVHAEAALQDFSYSIHMFLVTPIYDFFTLTLSVSLLSQLSVLQKRCLETEAHLKGKYVWEYRNIIIPYATRLAGLHRNEPYKHMALVKNKHGLALMDQMVS